MADSGAAASGLVRRDIIQEEEEKDRRDCGGWRGCHHCNQGWLQQQAVGKRETQGKLELALMPGSAQQHQQAFARH